MALEPHRDGHAEGLADLIDRILDKGLVVNADIAVSVAGVELLGIKIRAALASFETAARYGLEFPSGTRLPAYDSPGHAAPMEELCPQCDRSVSVHTLMTEGCPWCGWVSSRHAPVEIQEE